MVCAQPPCDKAILVSKRLGNIVPGAFTPMLVKHSKPFSLVDCISLGVDWMRNLSNSRNCQDERCTSSRVVFDVYCSPVCLDKCACKY